MISEIREGPINIFKRVFNQQNIKAPKKCKTKIMNVNLVVEINEAE